jgi:hypothetical protein
MGTIQRRHLATSTPRDLNTGFPIFAARSTADRPAFPQRIGGGTLQVDRERFAFRFTIPFGLWRVHVDLNGTFFIGSFFGFNLEYDVSGVTLNDGSGSLIISNDSAAGGMGIGISFQLGGNIRTERGRLVVSFTDPIRWEQTFNQPFDVNIDLIQVALIAINVASGGQVPLDLIRGAQTVGSVGNIWGLFAEARNQFGTRGRMELVPRISLSPNILEFIPKAGSVIRGLRKAGIRFSIGPTINITFPVRFSIVRLVTEDGIYPVNRVSGSVQLLRGGPVRTLPPTVSQVTVVHSHTATLGFNLELRFVLTFLGMWGLDHSIPIGVNFVQAGAEINNLTGPFFTALQGGPETVSDVEIPEVVWGSA